MCLRVLQGHLNRPQKATGFSYFLRERLQPVWRPVCWLPQHKTGLHSQRKALLPIRLPSSPLPLLGTTPPRPPPRWKGTALWCHEEPGGARKASGTGEKDTRCTLSNISGPILGIMLLKPGEIKHTGGHLQCVRLPPPSARPLMGRELSSLLPRPWAPKPPPILSSGRQTRDHPAGVTIGLQIPPGTVTEQPVWDNFCDSFIRIQTE